MMAFYIRCPMAGIDDVADMLTSPCHRLHAVADVDVAHERIEVLGGRHHAQATECNPRQIMWHTIRCNGRMQLRRHVRVDAILAWIHVGSGPEKCRRLLHGNGQGTADEPVGCWMVGGAGEGQGTVDTVRGWGQRRRILCTLSRVYLFHSLFLSISLPPPSPLSHSLSPHPPLSRRSLSPLSHPLHTYADDDKK